MMPGDLDYGGMEYAMAVASAGRRKAVSLVTSFDVGKHVLDEAIRIARETAAAESSALVARHEEEWARYWSASGVELNDPDFQTWWYRMAYFLRCFAKPGVVPVGLWGVLPDDAPGWHGDYHHNYNAWQPYWTPLVLNHPELADPWVRYMNELLPRLRWFARTTYDCEGACVGISTFAFEPDPAKSKSVNQRQIALAPWGYTVGMAGMSAQILWYCHLYRPDRTYLEEKIYPVIREVALFYCSFAEKCPRDAQGKAKFGPSYSPEHGDFGVANVPFDLAYARFTLKAALAAARELGRDEAMAGRFAKALDLLPGYPTAPDASGQPVVVDWTGCKFREIGEHNITVPAVPVFPADQVTWFSPESEKELFRNTIRQTRHRGCNSTVMFSVAKARLSMLDALDDARQYYRPQVQPNGMFYWPMHGFYLSESVGIAAMISEFLVQSVDSIIRIFPCWPKDRDASFANLRAQGGFLVSARQTGGQVVFVHIRSTVGGRLKFLNPWSTVPQAIQNGAVASVTDEGGGVFSLGTIVGGLVELSP
jgi:alpha-L-fucosidase 2